MKFIAGLQHKQLIETTSKQLLKTALAAEEPQYYDFADILWGDVDGSAEPLEEVLIFLVLVHPHTTT